MPNKIWRKNNEEKLRSYRRRWYYKNREDAKNKTKERKEKIREWFKDYKSNLCCIQCGESHTACLEFHHKKPDEKDINASAIINQGWCIERFKKELDKCDVLCANCHRKLHYKL